MNHLPITQPVPPLPSEHFVPPSCPILTATQSAVRDAMRTHAIVNDRADDIILTLRSHKFLKALMQVWVVNRTPKTMKPNQNRLISDVMYQTLLSNMTDEEVCQAFSEAYPKAKLPQV